MHTFIVKRLAAALPVVLLTSIIVFLLMRMLPGDPILMIIDPHAEVSPETIAALRLEYGLDEPIHVQYLKWAQRTLSGDFGRSVINRQPVWDVIEPRILPTVQIGLTGWLLALIVALPLGAYTATRLHSWADWLGTVLALVGAAMPYFLIGGILIYLLALKAGLLPASGFVSPFDDPWASFKTTVMPAITLSLGLAAVIARQSRSSFADVMQHAYVRTARAKGLPEHSVMLRHAFRNAMLPIVTILGLQLGTLFSGAVITETVFAVPGMGRLLVDAILSRDYPVVQAVVVFIIFAVIVANLAVDIAYGFLDPRTRQG